MPINPKERFKRMTLISEGLSTTHPDNVVHIVSINHPELSEHNAGVVSTATIPVAARAIAHSTHRVANADEVADYKQEMEDRKRHYREEEYERRANAGQVVEHHPFQPEASEKKDPPKPPSERGRKPSDAPTL